jgi:8-oxo-dGTP pyrophosphatase MutT (NUDIX family)
MRRADNAPMASSSSRAERLDGFAPSAPAVILCKAQAVACPTRNAVKIVLLNDADELLLMCMDDPTITSIGLAYSGPFWTLIGGEMEPNETIAEAAERELFEETGLTREDVEFGPHVWFGELDLILYGEPTHIRQEFVVARTRCRDVSLANLTDAEKMVVTQLSWFSLDRLIGGGEVVHPTRLPEYLPDVIAGKYPREPIEIDLAAGKKS